MYVFEINPFTILQTYLMKHLLKWLAFFVWFNAIITLWMCWYNLLLGNWFDPIGIDFWLVSLLVSMWILFWLMWWIIIYSLSIEKRLW